METLQEININQIIQESLKKGMSYSEYRKLVTHLAVNNLTTGNEKTEDLVEYTKLNDRRMKRWDKTLKVSNDIKEKVERFNKKTTWLVLTESWCGDAAHVIPAVNKVSELNNGIDLRLVLRDENQDLMDAFLTNGGRAIPKLIAIDNNSENVIDTYGPRPSIATGFVNDFKKNNGSLSPEFKKDLQIWYNKDKGQTTFKDLINLLNG